jgi:hypothetical protein
VQQPFPAPHHAHMTGGPIRLHAGESLLQDRQTPCLLEPFTLGPIPARHTAGALCPQLLAEPMPDRRDPVREGPDVRSLRAPRQTPLVVRRLGDGTRSDTCRR